MESPIDGSWSKGHGSLNIRNKSSGPPVRGQIHWEVFAVKQGDMKRGVIDAIWHMMGDVHLGNIRLSFDDGGRDPLYLELLFGSDAFSQADVLLLQQSSQIKWPPIVNEISKRTGLDIDLA